MKAIEKYIEFYKYLNSNTSVEEYKVFFDEKSYFEDPFQKVNGVEKIYKIFEDMYKKLHNPHFEVIEHISNEDTSYIKWNFYFAMSSKSKEEFFVGVSRVVFNENGKVKEHIDFWDAGKNVYEKIPILSFIIRFIKRKMHA